MATSDIDSFDKPQFNPNYYEPPRQRGCLFYGCLFAAVAAVLIMVAIGALTFVAFRWFGHQIEEYSATAPVALPKIEIAEEDRRGLEERVAEFRKALDSGTATAPLVLTSNDLNALIEASSALKNKIYVAVENDKIKGQVSLPLEEYAVWPFENMLKGRFLNGEADVKVSLVDGVLLVLLDSFEVNGKRPPEAALEKLRSQNLASDVYKDSKNADQIRKLESIRITNGKVIITARDLHATPKAESPKLPDEVLAPTAAKKPSEPAPKPASEPAPATPDPKAPKAG